MTVQKPADAASGWRPLAWFFSLQAEGPSLKSSPTANSNFCTSSYFKNGPTSRFLVI